MKIVIIDDESVICAGIQKIIESSENSWEVADIYTDPEEALEFCDWDKVDLLLADINMPNIDGLTLVDTLHERGHDVQVIFVSGYSEFKYAQKAIQQKALDYIIKPVSVVNLKKSIKKAQEYVLQKKKMLSEEEFIKNNLSAITKEFLYEMLFETKRLSEEEIEDNQHYCNLKSTRFSLISFTLETSERCENQIRALPEENEKLFIYANNSLYNIILVCEDKNKPVEIDSMVKGFKNAYPKMSIYQIKTTDNVRELANINYDMMVKHKEDLLGNDKAKSEMFEKTDGCEYDDEYSSHVKSAIDYIKTNYSKKISLSSLSEELYVHPTYLSNLFKKQTDTNIIDFINNYRIEIAKELLKDSRNKVYWVAERVGFANQRYFSQKFKKLTGYTPVEYKQKAFFSSIS
jgi:two-component system response regulator YesN